LIVNYQFGDWKNNRTVGYVVGFLVTLPALQDWIPNKSPLLRHDQGGP